MDPPTEIFAFSKKKKFISDFFYFLRCKKTARFKPKNLNIKKINKKCMILHCKNAEMTILHCKNAEVTISSFLHFYSVKSYNFCLFFFSDPNMFQIK